MHVKETLLESKNKLLSNKRAIIFFCYLSSLLLVAFGQPDRHVLLNMGAYLFGYPLFFYSLYSTERKNVRIVLSVLWGVAVQLFQLSWLATTYYHGRGIIAAYLFLALLFGSQTVLFAYLITGRDLFIRRALGVASFWTVIEWSRLFLLCGFPFNLAGLVLTFHAIGAQLASLLGVFVLSFWVIFTGFIGMKFLIRKSFRSLCLWMIIAGFPFLYGWGRFMYHIEMDQTSQPLKVALVQTGLFPDEKWDFGEADTEAMHPLLQWRRVLNFLQLHKQARFDLIVLPECAFPHSATLSTFLLDQVKEILKIEWGEESLDNLPVDLVEEGGYVGNLFFAKALGNYYDADVLLGLTYHESGGEQAYNSAFFVGKGNKGISRYDKQVLVPMAEYLPSKYFGSFLARYGLNSFFTPGKKAVVFDGKVPLSASICYEEGYNYIIREGRKQGAKLFVNVTNDAWFPSSRLPQDHYNIGRLRAVENGVVLLRSCNSGVTAAVDQFGREINQFAKGDVDQEGKGGVLLLTVQTKDIPTLFAKCGNALLLCLCALFLTIFFMFRKTCPKS